MPTEKVHIVRIVPAWLSVVAIVALATIGLYFRGAYVLAHRPPPATATVNAAGSVASIPARYLDAYVRGSARSGVPWWDLAAIGDVESHHGALFPGSSVDAVGFVIPAMQRWDVGAVSWGSMQVQTYNVDAHGSDGNGDGKVDVMERQQLDDVVATAADLLVSNGYASNRREAVRRYNGSGPAAEAYADRVVALGDLYRAQGGSVGASVAIGAGERTDVTPGAVVAYWASGALARWTGVAPESGNKLSAVYAGADPAVRSMLGSLAGRTVRVAGSSRSTPQGDRIAAAARGWAGRDYRPGVRERCAEWVRVVLSEASVTPAPEVTAMSLDGWNEGTGPAMANSFGPDQGEAVARVEDLAPGDVVMFLDTYGDWTAKPGFPGVITHVGIYVGNGQIVDRPTASAPVQLRAVTTFRFGGAVRLRTGTLV